MLVTGKDILTLLLFQSKGILIIKDLKRFKKIIEELNVLVEEAYSYLSESEKERARGYWYANIITSLNKNHCFLSNCPYTMDDSAKNDTTVKE